MNLKLVDKIVLVIGSLKGIEKAIAVKFKDEGCKKGIICPRSKNILVTAKDEIE